jgi:hypothetical protein
MAIRGTQRMRTMIEATMPIIASGLHPSLLDERGAAEGAGGTAVDADILVILMSVT